ncbi:related to beta-N-acetylglucosaminidase [Cephalotrichum gorgonifer]|uniref:Related to beta-N-acetylglucosaminidase n=1 Tax=Cephalotrichum gorgonifer TaxID=2041049 RepID=A0AAE8MSX3_9PEZI|nr:related to beta-N-acetylglucosaminidase [Cephalotrichum gorgonifer]
MLPAPHTVAPSSRPGATHPSAKLLRDHQDCVPLRRILSDGDLIVLLSPVVAPWSSSRSGSDGQSLTSDPFEPFGLALADRHPWVRHVAYNKTAGITGTHAAFIKRARVVIFVISGPPAPNDPPQAELAEICRALGGEAGPRHIVLACFDVRSSTVQVTPFDTVVQIPDYSPAELRAAASLLFGEPEREPESDVEMEYEREREVYGNPVRAPSEPPRSWPVEPWSPTDLPDVHALWHACLPPKFHLEKRILASLLNRDGYAMHYVVRDPATRAVLGFCATYLTYADAGGERLLGSLALILVRESHRGRGVGLCLHNEALRRLKRVRGVARIQLGSTFPRLLYGIPAELGTSATGWLARRGWDVLGRGARHVSDWVLEFADFTHRRPDDVSSAAGGRLAFRACAPADLDLVLDLVDRECVRRDTMGWFDQYARLAGSLSVEEDILVGLEDGRVVACALVYLPGSGSPVGEDLPWAGQLGAGVGGVTCVCIAGETADLVRARDSIMAGLLDASVKSLARRGMRAMFVDGVREGEDVFYPLGFKKWAAYREAWAEGMSMKENGAA